MITIHADPNLADIFVGEANPAEARFYARLPSPASDDVCLTGTVSGPFCPYANTLPARVPLVDQGPGPTLLAQAIVPDPCFWTPDLPFQYEVEVQLAASAAGKDATLPRESTRFKRTLGIRPLLVRGNSLALEGKIWVLRGATSSSVNDLSLAKRHDVGLAMLVTNPDDALCKQASHIGVLLVADLTVPVEQIAPSEWIADELRRLSNFAAVGFAVLPTRDELDESQLDLPADDLLSAARGIILVQCVVAASDKIQPWARALLCPADDLDVAAAIAAASPLPVIVRRSVPNPTTIDDARRECDHLQRDLAGRGNFAGYLV
jgi:hypothetical protein